MAKVTWTKRSIEDIYEIREYYLSYSPKLATETTDQIFEKGEYLSQFPKLGRIVPEFDNKDLRELIYNNYRIIYRLVGQESVHILSVHSSFRPLTQIEIWE